MNTDVIWDLSLITKEEVEILSGNEVLKKRYTDKNRFQIEANKFLKQGRLMDIRIHTRFIDFPEHTHNYIEMMYVCSGAITHWIGEKRIVMSAGDILCMNQYVTHRTEAAGQHDIGINFIIRPEFLDIPLQMVESNNAIAHFLINILRNNYATPEYLYFRAGKVQEIDNLMENMVRTLKTSSNDVDEINKYTMGLAFLYLMNHTETLEADSPHNYTDTMIQVVLRYINTHFKDANLTNLANEMNQSFSGLSRLIKAETGSTFKELLQRKKLQKAVELLIESELPIADIIMAVGYENSTYFYKKFREQYQISPKEFRDYYKMYPNKRIKV